MKNNCDENSTPAKENMDWNRRLFTALLNSEYADQMKEGLALSFPMPGLSGEKKVIRVFLYPASSYTRQFGAPVMHFCMHTKDLSVLACHEVMEFDQEEIFSWEENLFNAEWQKDTIQGMSVRFDDILEEAFSATEEACQRAVKWLSDLASITGNQYRFYEWLSPEYIDWAVSDENQN